MVSAEPLTPRRPSNRSRALHRIRIWMVVLLAVFAGRWWWQNRERPTVALPLRYRLLAAADQPPGTVVDIAGMTGFAWDTLHVVAPDTPPADVARQLGVPWSGPEPAPVSAGTGQLLVFVAGQQVVGHFDVGRLFVAPPRPIPRAQAKFVAGAGGLTWQGGG